MISRPSATSRHYSAHSTHPRPRKTPPNGGYLTPFRHLALLWHQCSSRALSPSLFEAALKATGYSCR